MVPRFARGILPGQKWPPLTIFGQGSKTAKSEFYPRIAPMERVALSSFTLAETQIGQASGPSPRWSSTEAGGFVEAVPGMGDPKWPAVVFVRQARYVLEDLRACSLASTPSAEVKRLGSATILLGNALRALDESPSSWGVLPSRRRDGAEFLGLLTAAARLCYVANHVLIAGDISDGVRHIRRARVDLGRALDLSLGRSR